MQNKLIKTAAMLLMAASMLLLSCEKWGDNPKTTIPDEPTQELITQSFGMKLVTEQSPMDVGTKSTKSWNPTTYVYNYSTVPATFKLTGTDNPRVYTLPNVTVAQLQAGVSMTILPGTYTATYATEHTRTTDVFSTNNISEFYPYMAQVADQLDIKIDQAGLHLTGTPIYLQATPEDALIVVDIPNVNNVRVSTNIDFSGDIPYLLFNTTDQFHWGYLNQTPLWVRFMAGIPTPVEKTIDASAYQKGNVYHIISAFGAITDLVITPMNINDVIVP